jgi:hypothetical protein
MKKFCVVQDWMHTPDDIMALTSLDARQRKQVHIMRCSASQLRRKSMPEMGIGVSRILCLLFLTIPIISTPNAYCQTAIPPKSEQKSGSTPASTPPQASLGKAMIKKNGGSITSFHLTASQSGTHPFTIGLGFKKGDIFNTPSLSIPDQQIIVKRRWNDGSVKHAIASGHISLSKNDSKLINVLDSPPAPVGAILNSMDIQKAKPQASVQLSGIGTVALTNLLANPFRTWISGPEMVESHYRSNVGEDPNLSVWFFVRLYKSGKAWVRVIVENGNVEATKLDVKSYVPAVIVGGAKVYDNGGIILNHYPHTRWSVEAWIGGDPQVSPKHDTTYLISTRLVPNYWKRNPADKAFAQLVQEYRPMDRGNLTQRMAVAGFQRQIGLLPLWDALYVSSGDLRAYRAALANASSLNTYPIVWRDPKTQLIASPSVYPEFGIGTRTYKAGPNIWEMNHAPSEGYLAYLITGDYWYYETALMHNSLVYLALNPKKGSGVNRLLTAETRGTGWNLRNLSQTVAIAPDGDSIATDFRELLANNMNHWKSVKDSLGGTGIGYLYEYNVNGYGRGTIAPWMQHFFIQSLGMGSDLEPLPDMTIYNEVRDWMYRGIVGILGDSSGFCFNYASGNHAIITDGASRDATTWFRDWASVYKATLGTAACGNSLAGKGSTAPVNGSKAYWGNLLPAIAYAVDHKAPGADAAWARLVGADNWHSLENSGFDNTPIWGIVPRSK